MNLATLKLWQCGFRENPIFTKIFCFAFPLSVVEPNTKLFCIVSVFPTQKLITRDGESCDDIWSVCIYTHGSWRERNSVGMSCLSGGRFPRRSEFIREFIVDEYRRATIPNIYLTTYLIFNVIWQSVKRNIQKRSQPIYIIFNYQYAVVISIRSYDQWVVKRLSQKIPARLWASSEIASFPSFSSFPSSPKVVS